MGKSSASGDVHAAAPPQGHLVDSARAGRPPPFSLSPKVVRAMQKRLDLMLPLAVGLLLTIGCGGPDRPVTYPATGTVLFQGEPVEGATVRFIPTDGRPASGQTDASGRFTLSTYEPDDGAVAGEHTVLVSKVVQLDPSDQSGYPEMRSVLPKQYGQANQSPLKVTVDAGGENDFPLELQP
jgi:hypothetical protein